MGRAVETRKITDQDDMGFLNSLISIQTGVDQRGERTVQREGFANTSQLILGDSIVDIEEQIIPGGQHRERGRRGGRGMLDL